MTGTAMTDTPKKLTPEQVEAFIAEHKLSIPAPRTNALGSFDVTSGALRVTDPCYSMDTWCAGTLENVKNGSWVAAVYEKVDEFDFNSDIAWMPLRRNDISEFFLETAIAMAETKGLEEDVQRMRQELKEHQERSQAKYIDSLRNCRGRINNLHAVHADYAHEDRFKPENIYQTLFVNGARTDIGVGVDSGQAGLFDLTHYERVARDGSAASAVDEEFYDVVCETTLAEGSAGVIEFKSHKIGVASSSGYGDGGYACHYVSNDQGEVIAVGINYIPEEQEEEQAAA